jgi:hypothetical protein
LILIPLVDLPVEFLAFCWGDGLTVTLHFLGQVLDVLVLAPADGSLADSPLRDQVETGIAGIWMCPSNLGMREMKLSKACIQLLQDIRFQEIIELIETRTPY